MRTSLVLFLLPALLQTFLTPALAIGVGVGPTTVTEPAPVQTQTTATTESTSEPITTSVEQTIVPIVALADTTPPVISGVAEASLGQTNATIIWSTNELATSHFRYGLTSSYGSTVTLGVSAALVHSVTLLDLTPNTIYHYCIDATDLSGNTATSCDHLLSTAVTLPLVDADTNPPTVTLITVAPVTTSTAMINWTTSEVADAQVEYGRTAGYGSLSMLDADLALTHRILLTHLESDTQYHFRVRSSDQIGNISYSPDETFTTNAIVTLGEAVLTNPEATSTVTTNIGSGNVSVSVASLVISSIETASLGSTEATITWHTDLLSDSQVEYGENSLFGSVLPVDSALTTNHSMTISGLTPGTNYFFRVKSKSVGAPVAIVSATHELNTLAIPLPTSFPANVSSVQASSLGTTATVTWNTDKPATSQVEYGLSTAYGEQTIVGTEFVSTHAVALQHLVSETIYHYRVKSIDTASNITYSDDHTFQSVLLPPVVTSPISSTTSTSSFPAPTAISDLTISAHNETSVTLVWRVASPDADASVEYDVRYSQSPITEFNFFAARQDHTTPIYLVDLQPNETNRTYVVAGLDARTTYYFAIKQKYPHSDWSAVSSSPSIQTVARASDPSSAEAGLVEGANDLVTTPDTSDSHYSQGGLHALNEKVYTPGMVNAPTFVHAEGDDQQIVLGWKNPHETSFVRTVVVKKDGSAPTSPTDGVVIYEGRSETFTDTSLVNGKTYYYALYSYNGAKQYSNPVHVSLAAVSDKTQVVFDETPFIVESTEVYHFVQTFKKGDQHLEVEHLQQILSADHRLYPERKVTGYFGALTERALKKFQKMHELPQTGVTDAATRKALHTASQTLLNLAIPEHLALFIMDLKLGQEGMEVADLQEFLLRDGVYKGSSITGIFDETTRRAVIAFQKKYHIQPASGLVRYKTRHVMRTIVGF